MEAEEINLKNKLREIRRELHQNPELSMEEWQTTVRLKKWLREYEIPVCPLPLPTGLVAEIQGGKPGL